MKRVSLLLLAMAGVVAPKMAAGEQNLPATPPGGILACVANNCTVVRKSDVGKVADLALVGLFAANKNREFRYCSANAQSKKCEEEDLGLLTLMAGIIPSRSAFVKGRVNDVETRGGTAFVAVSNSHRHMGTTVWCRDGKYVISVKDDSTISLKQDAFYCNWAVVGNVGVTMEIVVDYLDVSKGRIGGSFSAGVVGTGLGGGSGYAMIEFDSPVSEPRIVRELSGLMSGPDLAAADLPKTTGPVPRPTESVSALPAIPKMEEPIREARRPPDVVSPKAKAVEKRLALVIGNAHYAKAPLRNPLNDADDFSRELRLSGFDVLDLRDASLAAMRQGVREFGDRLKSYDIGLVYYSGHGLELRGKNYLLPVNHDIQREDEIQDQSLEVNLILEKMNSANNNFNILIIDACRDNPFFRSFRSIGRGLAQMDAPVGTLIAFSTAPGKTALDGTGRNSPYTKHLLAAIPKADYPIESVFKDIRRGVIAETKGSQTPWESTSLTGEFFFRVSK